MTAYSLCIYNHITYIQVDLNFWGSNKRTEWLPWQHVNIIPDIFSEEFPYCKLGISWWLLLNRDALGRTPAQKINLHVENSEKNNKYYNLYLHVGFFFFTKNLRRWCFVVNRFIILPLWFILILIPFTFPFFSVTHNLRKKESTCTQKEVGDFSISDMNNICVNKVTLITLMPINIEIDQITIDFISASVLKEYSHAIFNY